MRDVVIQAFSLPGIFYQEVLRGVDTPTNDFTFHQNMSQTSVDSRFRTWMRPERVSERFKDVERLVFIERKKSLHPPL